MDIPVFTKFEVPSIHPQLAKGMMSLIEIFVPPLFFMLAGLVLAMSRNQGDKPGTAVRFVWRKFLRLMIPFAAGLFALVLWYMSRLIREVEVLDVGDIVRRERV